MDRDGEDERGGEREEERREEQTERGGEEVGGNRWREWSWVLMIWVPACTSRKGQ